MEENSHKRRQNMYYMRYIAEDDIANMHYIMYLSGAIYINYIFIHGARVLISSAANSYILLYATM